MALPRTLPGSDPAWHLYVVRTADPDPLGAALRQMGIGARSYYRPPVHEQPAMQEFAPAHPLPGTEQATHTNLAIPMHPALNHADIAEVVRGVRRHLTAAAAL